MAGHGPPDDGDPVTTCGARLRGGCVFGLLVLILSIGALAWAWKRPPAAIVGHADYVALGSSFAAGPGVGQRDKGSPFLCARSSSNYAHLLAHRLGLSLRDMTCSGATIADVLSERQAHQPPQIQGVDRDTKLVTVTVGGNDVGYLGNLAAESCTDARGRVPILWRPFVCSAMPEARVTAAFTALPDRMTTLVRAIRARAPEARIMLVDYMTVLPANGDCPERSPLTVDQIRMGRLVAERLRDITRGVAQREAISYVAASSVTAGHDMCSRVPWVNGLVFQTMPLAWGPFGYHPREEAMKAIADAAASTLAVKSR